METCHTASTWLFRNILRMVTTGRVLTPLPFLRAGSRLSPKHRGQFGCQVAAHILLSISTSCISGHIFSDEVEGIQRTDLREKQPYQECESSDTCSCYQGQHKSIWHLCENWKKAAPLGRWGSAGALLGGSWGFGRHYRKMLFLHCK